MEINYIGKNDDCEIQIIYLGLYNQKRLSFLEVSGTSWKNTPGRYRDILELIK